MYRASKRVRLVSGFLALLLSVFGFVSLAGAEEGLVGQWNFDKGEGDVLYDSSGNKNHGKIHGAKWVKLDKGYALEFDGKDDYVNCGKRSCLNLSSGDFTIKVRVKETGNINTFRGIVSKMVKACKGYSIIKVKDNRFRSGIGDGKFHYLTGNKVYTDTDWHEVTAVRRKGINYLYVDGVQQTATSTETMVDSNHNLVFGRFYSDTGKLWFKGMISEVAIYNRALTEDKIKVKVE